ncbi:MAG: rane protein of unknown function [Chloroflexi bacterium]|nr:rane protein of unknown function [Chloroflexota bacterium]
MYETPEKVSADPKALRRPWGGLALPFALATLVLFTYSATFAWRVHQDGNALNFAVLGTSNTPGNHGYDGQYYYRIAVAPLGGPHGLDKPAYRYQRIGYPLVARGLAYGLNIELPSALVLVNVGAIALGTLLVALLLRDAGVSPLFAVAWAAYAGQVASFWRDLAEPLAMALVALAILLARRDRWWPAACALLLAALTKETSLLFVAAAGAHIAFNGRLRLLGVLAAVVGLPYVAWQIGLHVAFGQTGFGGADRPPMIPFGGLAATRGLAERLGELLVVVGPALLSLALVAAALRLAGRSGGRMLWNQAMSLPTLALVANLAFVCWLPGRSYADLWAAARNADGLVLAVLTHPALSSARIRWVLVGAWTCSAPFLWFH